MKCINFTVLIDFNDFQHRNKNSNDIFGPIVELIKSSGIEKMKNLLKTPSKSEVSPAKNFQSNETENKTLSSGFFVKYCGSISTGTEGDVKQIERAIWCLLRSRETKLIPVKFECLEIGIKVTLDSDETVIPVKLILILIFFHLNI